MHVNQGALTGRFSMDERKKVMKKTYKNCMCGSKPKVNGRTVECSSKTCTSIVIMPTKEAARILWNKPHNEKGRV